MEMKLVIGYIFFILAVILMFGHLFIFGTESTDIAWIIRVVAIGLAIVGAVLTTEKK
jgi:hypothetical protein